MNNQPNNEEELLSSTGLAPEMGASDNLNTNTAPVDSAGVEGPVTPVNQTQESPAANPQPQIEQVTPQPEVVNQPQMNQPQVEAETPASQTTQVPNMSTPSGNGQMNFNNQQPKKKNLPFIIIVAVLGAIIVGLLVYMLLGGKFSSSDKPKNDPVNDKKDINQPVKPNEDPTEDPTQISNENTITVGNYVMQIPSGYVLKDYNGQPALINSSQQILLAMEVEKNASYSDLVAEINNIDPSQISNYVENGTMDIKEKKFGGKSWVVCDTVVEGQSMQLSFTQIGSSDILMTVIFDVGQMMDESVVYSDLNKMIKGAKDNGSSSFSKTKKKVSDIKFDQKLSKVDSKIFK